MLTSMPPVVRQGSVAVVSRALPRARRCSAHLHGLRQHFQIGRIDSAPQLGRGDRITVLAK
jgi:hypothetical protein